MTRGILIAGNESSLASALEAEAVKRVEYCATAYIPNRLEPVAGSSGAGTPSSVLRPSTLPKGRIALPWNPGSPVSARTLILAAENRLEHIDEAILVCTPPAVRKYPGELVSTEIEIMINDHVKGWFFLVKELAVSFKARKTGTLALVLNDPEPAPKDSTPDLLGNAAAAAFRAFAQGILDSALVEPFQMMGFSAPDAVDEGAFAAFIFRMIEEGGKRNNGKWLRLGRGINLFGR